MYIESWKQYCNIMLRQRAFSPKALVDLRWGISRTKNPWSFGCSLSKHQSDYETLHNPHQTENQQNNLINCVMILSLQFKLPFFFQKLITTVIIQADTIVICNILIHSEQIIEILHLIFHLKIELSPLSLPQLSYGQECCNSSFWWHLQWSYIWQQWCQCLQSLQCEVQKTFPWCSPCLQFSPSAYRRCQIFQRCSSHWTQTDVHLDSLGAFPWFSGTASGILHSVGCIHLVFAEAQVCKKGKGIHETVSTNTVKITWV